MKRNKNETAGIITPEHIYNYNESRPTNWKLGEKSPTKSVSKDVKCR